MTFKNQKNNEASGGLPVPPKKNTGRTPLCESTGTCCSNTGNQKVGLELPCRIGRDRDRSQIRKFESWSPIMTDESWSDPLVESWSPPKPIFGTPVKVNTEKMVVPCRIGNDQITSEIRKSESWSLLEPVIGTPTKVTGKDVVDEKISTPHFLPQFFSSPGKDKDELEGSRSSKSLLGERRKLWSTFAQAESKTRFSNMKRSLVFDDDECSGAKELKRSTSIIYNKNSPVGNEKSVQVAVEIQNNELIDFAEATENAIGFVANENLSPLRRPNEWLTSECIDVFLHHLSRQSNIKLNYISSQFFGPGVAEAMRRTDIAEAYFQFVAMDPDKHLIIPWCMPNHWTFILIDPVKFGWTFFDSHHPVDIRNVPGEIKEQIAVINCNEPEPNQLKFVGFESQIQRDDWSCGHRVLLTCSMLVLGRNPKNLGLQQVVRIRENILARMSLENFDFNGLKQELVAIEFGREPSMSIWYDNAEFVIPNNSLDVFRKKGTPLNGPGINSFLCHTAGQTSNPFKYTPAGYFGSSAIPVIGKSEIAKAYFKFANECADKKLIIPWLVEMNHWSFIMIDRGELKWTYFDSFLAVDIRNVPQEIMQQFELINEQQQPQNRLSFFSFETQIQTDEWSSGHRVILTSLMLIENLNPHKLGSQQIDHLQKILSKMDVRKFDCSELLKELRAISEFGGEVEKEPSKFHCSVCNKYFQRLQGLKSHEKSTLHLMKLKKVEENGNGNVSMKKCNVCGFLCETIEVMENHLKNSPGCRSETRIQCPFCFQVTRSKKGLSNHLKNSRSCKEVQTSSQAEIECPICSTNLTDRDALVEHLQKGNGCKSRRELADESLDRSVSGIVVVDSDDDNVSTESDAIIPDIQSSFPCQSCNDIFVTLAGLKHHVSSSAECKEGASAVLPFDERKYQLNMIKYWNHLLAEKLLFIKCDNCKEIVMSRECSQCKKDPLTFSEANDAHPKEIPEIMKKISPHMSACISRINVVKPIFDTNTAVKGKVLNFINPIQTILNQLPSENKIIVIDKVSPNGRVTNYLIEQKLLYEILTFLRDNNRFFSDIVINRRLDEFDADASNHSVHERDLEMLKEAENLYDSSLRLDKSHFDMIREKFDNYLKNYRGEKLKMSSERNQGLSPLSTNGYLQKARPDLFPFGEMNLSNSERGCPIELLKMLSHILKLEDMRFCQDPKLPYVLMDLKNRYQASRDTKFFLSTHPSEAAMSADQLMEMPEKELIKKVWPSLHTSLGSIGYFKYKRNHLKLMINQLGFPDLLVTFSLADNRLPSLEKFYRKLGIDTSNKTLFQLNNENPLYQIVYSKIALETYFDCILKKVIAVDDHFTTYEFQDRGSLHSHSVIWLDKKEGPTVRTTDMDNPEERQKLADYLGQIVNANKGDLPAGVELSAIEHPSVKRCKDSDVDLYVCKDKLQTHVHSEYCLRRNDKCRFDYGQKEETERAKFNVVNGIPKFVCPRNDKDVVAHNDIILRSWRSNSNIEVISSTEILLVYMTKYLTGKDQTSLTSVFSEILEKHKEKEDSSVYRIIMDVMKQNSGSKMICIQEIMFRLQSEDLINTSRSVKRIDANSRILSRDGKSEMPDYLKAYLARHNNHVNKRLSDIESYSLFEFMKKVDFKKGKGGRFTYSARNRACIVSFGLKYVSPQDPGHEDYIIEWCVYFSPQSDELVRRPFEESLHIYNTVIADKFNGKDPCDYELGNRKLIDTTPFDNPIVDPAPDGPGNMNMEDIFEGESDFSDRDLHEPVRVQENIIRLSQADLLPIKAAWKRMRLENKSSGEGVAGFISGMNEEQRFAFEIATDNSYRKCIIIGKAGTGKSFFINALREHYGEEIMVSAPTGVAADNIRAQTLHSVLHIGGGYMAEMTNSNTIANFIEDFERIKVLVIDEYTMISAKMLSFVDKRLRVAKNAPDSEFGGIKIILCGDPRQLPPVGEKPLWAIPDAKEGKELNVDEVVGLELYASFTTVAVLNQSVRQRAGSFFAGLCDRLGAAKITEQDYELLNGLKDTNNFENSISLCVRRNRASFINETEIDKLTTKAFTINATDKGNQVAEKNRKPEIQGLHLSLKLKVGAKVMLTTNLNVETGLVNGSTGTVMGLYVDESNNCVGALVDFEKYSGQCAINPDHPNQLPILMIEKSERGTRRLMMPLVLCWAMTIHKSQGLTLERIDVHLDSREDTAGQTFVGVSRVKAIENLRVHDMTHKRMGFMMESTRDSAKPKDFMRRMQHIEDLNVFAEKTRAKHADRADDA